MTKSGLDYQNYAVLEKVALGQIKVAKQSAAVAGVLLQRGEVEISPDKKIRKKAETVRLSRKLVDILQTELDNHRIARVLFIRSLALKALGTEVLVNRFMSQRHPILGTSPSEKLQTEWGAREVEDLLFGAMHGLPA